MRAIRPTRQTSTWRESSAASLLRRQCSGSFRDCLHTCCGQDIPTLRTPPTIGGMTAFNLNITSQPAIIDKAARGRLNGHRPAAIWFTGLSGAGKSTIANLVDAELHARGVHSCVLDGDNLRLGLCKDLGFSATDRAENVRRAGEVARLLVDAGLVVLCSLISPFRAERGLVRGLFGPDEFIEVFVDTPIEECIRRDPKGLYARAHAGAIKDFTGIDSPYEVPDSPEVIVRTDLWPPATCAMFVLEALADATGRSYDADGTSAR